MKKTIVINQKFTLGARTLCYMAMELSSGSYEIENISDKDIRDMLASGEADIKGWRLSEDGKTAEMVEGMNIVKVSGLSYSPLFPITGIVSEIHTCIGVDRKAGQYEVITSKFGRKKLDEAMIKSLAQLGAVMNGIEVREDGTVHTWFDEQEAPATEQEDKKKK